MWYFLIVVFIVMPLNGSFIVNGQEILGVVLMLTQLPYFYGIAKEIEGKGCAKVFK